MRTGLPLYPRRGITIEMKFKQLGETAGLSLIYENNDDVLLEVYDEETNEAMCVSLPVEDLALIAECINHILKKDAKK